MSTTTQKETTKPSGQALVNKTTKKPTKPNAAVNENESVETLENHDTQPEQRVDAVTLMKQSNQNECKLGATCVAKRLHEGSPIIDKETGKQKINLNTGETMSYADKYYTTLTFDGGEIETEVTKEQYNDVLQEGGRYSCTGRLSPVRVYGQTQIMPVYYAFTRLY